MFIGHSSSNCSAFYLYRATCVGPMPHPLLLHMHAYQGADLLNGSVRTLQYLWWLSLDVEGYFQWTMQSKVSFQFPAEYNLKLDSSCFLYQGHKESLIFLGSVTTKVLYQPSIVTES